MRYARVWAEFMRLSLRRLPALTAVMLTLLTVNMVVPVATALALRGVVDASASRQETTAVLAAVGFALVSCLGFVLGTVMSWLRIILVERVGFTDVQAGIVESVFGIEGIGHLERTDYLDRVTVLRYAAWSLADSLWSTLLAVFGAGEVVLTLFVLGSVSPWLLFLLLFAAAPLWFDSRGRLIVARAETDSAEDFRLQRHLFEMATSAAAGKEIRLSASAADLVARQEAAYDAAMRVRTRAQIAAALWRAAGWGVFALGFVAGLALVIWRAAHGHGSAGDVVLTVTVANSLRQSIRTTVQRTTISAGSRRVLDPFLWLRDYAAGERAQAAAVVAGAQSDAGTAPGSARSSARGSAASGIVLSDVSYTYPGTARPALSGVSVTLPAGSVVAVVGEYGSGKTTLVKLLCKFYRPDSGTITVNGTDLAAIDTAAWRSGISAAFQDFGRYNATLRETIQLGSGLDERSTSAGDAVFSGDAVLPGDVVLAGDAVLAGDETVLAAIEEADALELLARLPDGLGTELGAKFGGIELSEGQWQKTALARACMRPFPGLLVLDEPTASLDAPSEHAVFRHHMARARATGTKAGTITVIVSHRFSTVAGADLILVMDEGRLVESGSHEDLLAVDGRYADLYNIQSAAYAS